MFMPMAMTVQQTEHVINTVLYKYMENTTENVVLHVFDTTVILKTEILCHRYSLKSSQKRIPSLGPKTIFLQNIELQCAGDEIAYYFICIVQLSCFMSLHIL